MAKKVKSKKIKSEKPRKPKLVKLYDTELEPLQEADSLLKQIETAESEAAERSLRVELCREELGNAKTAYKDAVTQLRRLCRARNEKHPLFDQSKPSELTKEQPAKEAARKSNEITIRLTKAVDDATNGFHGITGETLTAAIDTQGDTYIPAHDGDVYLEAEEFEVVEGMPEINYNQPGTAVTIELTEDCLDVDKQLVKGNTYHPWSVSRKGVELLLNGKEVFVAKSCFVFVTGRHLVEDALIEHEEGFNASTWQAWLRSRPEARRPTIVVTDGSALKSHATNEAWRDLPLSSAGIDGKVGVLLAEAGHDTLGRLAKLMQEHGQWWNKEVKGIGEAGATEVADQFAQFWKEHPEYCAA